MAPRWRRRRNQTFHGSSHGSVGRHDESSWNSKHHAGVKIKGRRWSDACSWQSLRGRTRPGRERGNNRTASAACAGEYRGIKGSNETSGRIKIDHELDL